MNLTESFEKIAQNYLGMTLKDKGCVNWMEMQKKMAQELKQVTESFLNEIKNEIDFEIRKDLTNGICLSGANITHMEHILKKKYVPKKVLRESLKTQMDYLQKIEKSKNKILAELNSL